MSTTASRSISVGFDSATDGIEYFQKFESEDFAPSLARNFSVDLVAGNNHIDVVDAVAITIIPPAGNLLKIWLKGADTDDGLTIHPTDPTSVGLYPSGSPQPGSNTFVVLEAEDDVTVRIIIS